MSWRATGIALASMSPGSLREILVGSSGIVLARVGPVVFAVDGVCPHLGGLLADGELAGRRLTCPLHQAVFDVADGSVLADPLGIAPPAGDVAPLTHYPTRVVAGMVEVDVP